MLDLVGQREGSGCWILWGGVRVQVLDLVGRREGSGCWILWGSVRV